MKNKILRNARKEANKTQYQVAQEANITEVSYQRIEYGLQRPSLNTALLIAKSLDSTVEDLFGIPQQQLRGNTKKPDGN